MTMTDQSQSPAHAVTNGRILELDALRGLAALAVVLFHYTTRYDELFGHADSLPAALPWGHYGVDLFFMLSGFVILMTLDRTAATWKFIWGRFSRLYPAYWAAVFLTFAAVIWFGLPGQEVSLGEAILNTTMIQALLGARHVDGAYWSLQAELIFYANMFVLYRLGAFRYPVTTVVCWVGAAVAIGLIQPIASVHSPWLASGLSKLATITSLNFIPLFGLGILLYTVRRSEHLSHMPLAAVAGCLAAIAILNSAAGAAADLVLLGTLWLAVNGRLPWLQGRPFISLGTLSYTLYLTHENIGYILIRELEQIGVAPATAILGAVAFSLLVATVIHRSIEKPSMTWLRSLSLPTLPPWRQWLPYVNRPTLDAPLADGNS